MFQIRAKVWRCTRLASRASCTSGRTSGGAKDHIAGDLDVDLRMMCTDENDIEELTGTCGLLCWQGYDEDADGFKKLRWYENYERIQL